MQRLVNCFITSEKLYNYIFTGVRRLQMLINTEPFRNLNATIVSVPECLLKHGEDTDEYWTCVIENRAHSFLHFTGSCKMGSVNDSSTVVDSRLRLVNFDF